ncbi:MAG TPA: hypothetical protein VLO07_04095, partial [Thermoanaerobaculia bacterium]|nr:hypothetical protein [Thermoanaerobaculia bacterium]
MRRARLCSSFLLLGSVLSATAGPYRPVSPPGLGLAVEFPASASPAAQRQLLQEIRHTGVSVFALTVSWSQAEPAPGQYRLGEVARAARLLRQSGATLHLDLPLVAGRSKDVPPDLTSVAFDDSKLSLRLGRLLDALRPALLDFSTLSLGYEADAYFADKPEQLRAYRRLFDGAVQFLRKQVPHLKVGVTTAAPTETEAPAVAAALHERSPVLFYIYAPFARESPFLHRPPDVLERDWKRLLDRAAPRPVAFAEVSYSSAAENGSSPEKQAEFVRRLRRFVAGSAGSSLLFVRYATWRDPPAGLLQVQSNVSEVARRRASCLANRG